MPTKENDVLLSAPAKISLWEPVTALRKVAIVDNGEPLVDFRVAYPDLMFDRPRFRYRRETLLRASVAERLNAADQSLRPRGYRIAIVEGWRAPHIQARMYRAAWERWRKLHPDWSDSQLRRVVNRFTAPLDKRVPPPHTTGGAMDILLADAATGALLDHSAPYIGFDPKSFSFDAPGLSDEARRIRAILAEAMLPTGISNYPSEYWHWSYGDQGWAYRESRPHALYNRITPDNYAAEPGDDIDAPLELIEEPEPAA